jgi:hypothetical protein
MERLGRVLEAVTEPFNLAEVKGAVEELTGQLFDPGEDWRESLFNHLVANEYVYQSTQVLKHPGKLEDAAWHTSQRLRIGRVPQGERANGELLAYLVLGAAARKNGESLLRPKVHFFLRGLDEMVVALEGTDAVPRLNVFLSLHEAKDQHPGRRDDAFFGVLVCRSCGQHFVEKWYQGLALSRGTRNQLKGFDHGNAVQDGQGKENAVWATAAVGDEGTGINIGEALRTAATRLLDMGPDDLQLLLVPKPDDKLDLLMYDPMPGGSGLLEQMLSRWRELVATARDVLAGCVQGCDTACYACLKTFRNQFHHGRLNRHDALVLMGRLDLDPQAYRDIAPVYEEQGQEAGTPSNPPEARLQRLLLDHHFPPGECRKRVTTTAGLSTEPDWLHEPTKVAVYLDGMSRGLHGDPQTARRDQLIRQTLELDDYRVIVVQSRDLNDPQAVRQHLKNIAEAIGRGDLPVFPEAAPAPTLQLQGDSRAAELEELLSLCDGRCQELLRGCGDGKRPLPVVGYELRDDTGRVTPHQAELAWESAGIAGVLPEALEAVTAFREQGWTVFLAGDADAPPLILDQLTE